jgi:hypothetical protein
MKFTVRQQIPARLSAVLDLYGNPAFFTSLPPTERLATPELVSREANGQLVVLRLRHRLTAELPSMVTRFVDPSRLTWIETTTLDMAAAGSASHMEPDNYPDLLRASARATFIATDGTTVRTVTGTVEVPVPIFGGKVEGAIVEGLEDYLLAEADAAARYLADTGP